MRLTRVRLGRFTLALSFAALFVGALIMPAFAAYSGLFDALDGAGAGSRRGFVALELFTDRDAALIADDLAADASAYYVNGKRRVRVIKELPGDPLSCALTEIRLRGALGRNAEVVRGATGVGYESDADFAASAFASGAYYTPALRESMENGRQFVARRYEGRTLYIIGEPFIPFDY